MRPEHLRMHASDRLENRVSVSADTAHNLTGELPVSAVNVDEILRLVKRLMAELPGAVIIHAPKQDYQFLYVRRGKFRGTPECRRDQVHQRIQILNKERNILRLHPEHSSIPLRQNARFIFPEICGGEVLPHQIFLLHDIAIAEDHAGRPSQGVEEPVEMWSGMAAGAAGAKLHDLHRNINGEFHSSIPSSIESRIGFLRFALLLQLTRPSHSGG